MDRKADESELGERTLVSMSTGSTALQPMTSRGQAPEEDSKPKREELQRITELMDGFKASKVTGSKHYL